MGPLAIKDKRTIKNIKLQPRALQALQLLCEWCGEQMWQKTLRDGALVSPQQAFQSSHQPTLDLRGYAHSIRKR